MAQSSTSTPPPPTCKDYYSKGLRSPTVDSVTDAITVNDGFPLGDIAVTIDLSHRRIGALVLSLTASPPSWAGSDIASRRVVLKERGLGRLGDNLYMTTFNDGAEEAFPVSAVGILINFLRNILLTLHIKYLYCRKMHHLGEPIDRPNGCPSSQTMPP